MLRYWGLSFTVAFLTLIKYIVFGCVNTGIVERTKEGFAVLSRTLPL